MSAHSVWNFDDAAIAASGVPERRHSVIAASIVGSIACEKFGTGIVSDDPKMTMMSSGTGHSQKNSAIGAASRPSPDCSWKATARSTTLNLAFTSSSLDSRGRW